MLLSTDGFFFSQPLDFSLVLLAEKNFLKIVDYSKVAFYEPWPKFYWASLEVAETCRLEKVPFKPENLENWNS